MEDCLFCKIVKGEIPSYKIYEDDDVFAFLDIACDAFGHTLVIPKKHCTNVLDADPDDLQKVIKVVQKIASHYVNDCGFSGVNIMNASGKDAGQSVFHLHFHIVPRKDGDKLDAWPFKGKKDFNLAEICEKLKISK